MNMAGFLVRLINKTSRILGLWVVRLVSWLVSTGYFVFKTDRVRAGLDFYRALFPGRSRWFYLGCVWKQFHEFADSYADRVGLELGRILIHDSTGFEYLREAAQAGQGGIILTSHLGNWEIGAGLFSQAGLSMTMLMGERDARQVGRQQKEDLRRRGLDVKVAVPEAGSPFGGLEVLQAIRRGGLVSIAGDIAWTEQRTRIPARFLGRRVMLPAAPHLLALTTGAPILTVFGHRLGRCRHHFVTHPPRWVKAASRAERGAALAASAQRFADDLEEALRRYPWQWAVFEPFLGPPFEDGDPGPPVVVEAGPTV
jgi:predicted LPLAT superfamily acyltransferase